MRVAVDTTELRDAAETMRQVVGQAQLARQQVEAMPGMDAWAPDLRIQATASHAIEALLRMTREAATAAAVLADDLDYAARDYEQTEDGLTIREKRLE